jgi:HD-GYP domain-containing protein (c-di-GMP phosphodiesterase class II)
MADSYDAMSAPRPYQEAKPHEVIMQILEEECGTKHDPYLLEKFKPIVARSSQHQPGV